MREGETVEPGEARTALPAPAVLLLLGSLALLAIFLGLEPLVSFGAYGSDSGEYATLTSSLLTHHAFLLAGYPGWGFGYPFFPGTFVVGGAVSAATGADPLLALELSIPVLGALSVVPMFFLFRRLIPSDTIGLLGAAITAVASPRLLIISHAAPVSLGDLLAVASLWALVEQRRDPRWWVILAITAPAMAVTHHLSCYFFLLVGIALVVGTELYSPGRWSGRFPARELLFFGAFAEGLLAYWYFYAPPFWTSIVAGTGPFQDRSYLFPVGVVAGVALLLLLLHVRRSWAAPGRLWHPIWTPRFPSWSHKLRDTGLIALLVFGGIALLLFVPIPGTTQSANAAALLWFLPIALCIPLVAGTSGIMPMTRLGPGVYAIVVVLGASAALAAATNNQSIPVERHVEYLIPALGLLAALGVGSALANLDLSPRKWPVAVSLLAVGLLLGANAAAGYPPPAALDGFQEGFTSADLAVASWMAISLPSGTSLAADHRLSDLYFFDSSENPASWDNEVCLFNGDNGSCARAELESSYLPNSVPVRVQGPIDVVAVDETMRVNGVALNPSEPAVPVSQAALERLEGPGFVELYSAGGQTVWWVDLSLVPSA